MAKEVKVGDNLKINSVDVYRYYGLPEGVNISYEKVSSGNAVPKTATTAPVQWSPGTARRTH